MNRSIFTGALQRVCYRIIGKMSRPLPERPFTDKELFHIKPSGAIFYMAIATQRFDEDQLCDYHSYFSVSASHLADMLVP
jgi:hypothetical protein